MDLKIGALLASGRLKPGMEEYLKQLGAKGVIRKPFDMAQMLQKIRKIVDEE